LAPLAVVAVLVLSSVARATPDQPATQAPAPAATSAELHFLDFEDDEFIQARHSGEPIVLYFEADWCAPCKELHAQTFRAPAVLKAAVGVRLFRVDMTKPTGHAERVRGAFRVAGLPTVVLFGPDGQERARRFGFIPPEDFAKMLDDSHKPAPSSRLDGAPARARLDPALAPVQRHVALTPSHFALTRS
jgi:thiol:disulfide interchange protein DsbD